jgi:predicted enzyme related to lactoylglutathione lyase
MRGATPFFEVADIAASAASLAEVGATIVEAVHEVGGGMSVAILVDAEGNTIGLSHTAQA